MKWAVNMRKKTLTICLSAAEVMELYGARKAVVWVMRDGQSYIWDEGLGKVVDEAMKAMFPLAFPVSGGNGDELLVEVKQVAWNEICDED